MKTTVQPSSNLSGSRRNFLKTAGVLALAAPAALSAQVPRPMPFPSEWWRGRLVMLAEGLIPLEYVLPPLDPPPALPLGLVPRLRADFPMAGSKDVLAIHVFVAPPPPTVPLPFPVTPPLVPQNPTDPLTLSYFEVKITAVELSRQPGLNLCLLGRVLVNNPAMFGDLTGAGFVLTTGFVLHQGAPADFTMLGAHVPGNHTTIAPLGKGTLLIR